MNLKQRAADQGILVTRDGSQKTTCPWCSHQRKNKRDRCLSVNSSSEKIVWKCHNCGKKGGVYVNQPDSGKMAGKQGHQHGNSGALWAAKFRKTWW